MHCKHFKHSKRCCKNVQRKKIGKPCFSTEKTVWLYLLCADRSWPAMQFRHIKWLVGFEHCIKWIISLLHYLGTWFIRYSAFHDRSHLILKIISWYTSEIKTHEIWQLMRRIIFKCWSYPLSQLLPQHKAVVWRQAGPRNQPILKHPSHTSLTWSAWSAEAHIFKNLIFTYLLPEKQGQSWMYSALVLSGHLKISDIVQSRKICPPQRCI